MSHNKHKEHRDKKHKHTQKEEHQKLLEHRHKVPAYIQRQNEQAAMALEKLREQKSPGTVHSIEGKDKPKSKF